MSSSDCWAVGYHHTGSTWHTLIEHWDGTSWDVMDSPNTNSPRENRLTGVTCVSASDCWAVGYYNVGNYYSGDPYQTLIEHWDGTSWVVVSSPNANATRHNVLSSVTCVSASDCWAVGSFGDVANGAAQTLIEHWDGTSWAIVSSPNVSATTNDELSGVTCVSASDCWAVGHGGTNQTQTLIEHWDGTSWVIVSSPNASASVYSTLLGVTCVSATDCWAVGEYATIVAGLAAVHRTLIEHWDGTSWALVTSPNTLTTEDNQLTGVTCVSASDCWAVGYSLRASTSWQTLINHWDGSSWAIVSSPSTSPREHNILSGVTCMAASECWAVGYFAPDISSYQTLIQRWDGASWAIVDSPNTKITKGNYLSDVTCVSVSDCWAVGHYLHFSEVTSTYQTLIKHWDGSSWAIVSSPSTSTTQPNFLTDVACVSASDCWAVGYAFATNTSQSLIQHWDGVSWSIVVSPNMPVTSNTLSSLTCTSASNCWAVGSYGGGAQGASIYQALFQRWDGTAWTIVPSPSTFMTQNNALSSVTCTSASACWAVGYSVDGTSQRTLIEHWDGTSWTIVSSPNPTTALSHSLSRVTCVSVSDCWAAGHYVTSSSKQTLIEHWDGTSWAIVSSPNTGATKDNVLRDVTCTSGSECWAVGYHGGNDATSTPRTLIERWDGTSWAIVNSPNKGVYNSLAGVTCASSADCWAVGHYFTGTTMVLRYTRNQPPAPG